MRALFTVAALFLLTANAPEEEAQAEPAHPVEGSWLVDLRLSLSDPEYSQPLEIAVSDANVVTGEFYGTLIEDGKVGEAQGRICMAFRTSDISGPYQHSACLVDGKLIGQSWGEGREFVLPWTAERK